MDNEQLRLLVFGVLLALIIPQVITMYAMDANGRKISPDKKRTCKLNEVEEDGICVCAPCYVKDNNGTCALCAPNCYESIDSDGQLVCSNEHPVDKTKQLTNTQEMLPQLTEKEMYKMGTLFSAAGHNLKSVNSKLPPGKTSSIYPNLDDYKNVEGTLLEDVIKRSLQSSLNFNDQYPFMTKKAPLLDRNDRLFDVKRQEREQPALNPNPENILHNGFDHRPEASALVGLSLGMSNNYPHTQLTEFANGDIMTSSKPINELHRPFILPEMTQRNEGGDNVKWVAPSTGVTQGGVAFFDEMTANKQNGEIQSRTPYGGYTNIPETSLYWQSKIPVRDSQGIKDLEMYQAGNPLYNVTEESNARTTIFRNAREPIIPNTVTNGFYGEFLDPMLDTTNAKKGFYATNRVSPDDIDYALIRDQSDNMTRPTNDRILPNYITSHGNDDAPLLRNYDTIRNTSNKFHDDVDDNHAIRSQLYGNSEIANPPNRGAEGQVNRQMGPIPSYNHLHLPLEINALDRSEILAVGPSNH